MKQRITEEQFNQLKEIQKEVWTNFCYQRGWTVRQEYGPWVAPSIDPNLILGFPSIGEMIEFLDDRAGDYITGVIKPEAKDLCDTLWTEVMEALEK